MAPASSKEFLDIQATIECGFTLKRLMKNSIPWSHESVIYVKKNLEPKSILFNSNMELELLCNYSFTAGNYNLIQKIINSRYGLR